ncbi:MAG: RsmD family RNA methyltransferase [Bacteroidetes bacterium]|nr:RsmD family RNA methyltransferase [Bacteroidota bacterium]
MNKNILNSEVQEFIQQNYGVDLHQLLLRKSPFPNVSMLEIVQQVHGKKVAEKKFQFLLCDTIIFPPNLNLEQASSESTGKYKASQIKGKSFVDITCGFGIDAYWISKNFSNIFLVEKNTELLEIVQHNWSVLGRDAHFINKDLHLFINENNNKYDVLYLDPARRNEHQKKVFLLEDLSPNLIEIQGKLLKIADRILVKLSPLIDIHYLAQTIENISEIHIVAVKNEVKELLVFISKSVERIQIKAINLESSEPEISFFLDEISLAKAQFSEPQKYLYLPNNALLKTGAFNWISQKYSLEKLHPNTHLYTSNEKIENFPGRVLTAKIINPKSLKKGEQYNIISKNYPLKPEEIKKKYQLKDGGEEYIIFTQSQKGKVVLSTKNL